MFEAIRHSAAYKQWTALKKIMELRGAKVITNSETKDAFTKEGIEARECRVVKSVPLRRGMLCWSDFERVCKVLKSEVVSEKGGIEGIESAIEG